LSKTAVDTRWARFSDHRGPPRAIATLCPTLNIDLIGPFTGQPQRYRVDRVSVHSMKASVWTEPPNSLMGGSALVWRRPTR